MKWYVVVFCFVLSIILFVVVGVVVVMFKLGFVGIV